MLLLLLFLLLLLLHTPLRHHRPPPKPRGRGRLQAAQRHQVAVRQGEGAGQASRRVAECHRVQLHPVILWALVAGVVVAVGVAVAVALAALHPGGERQHQQQVALVLLLNSCRQQQAARYL